VGSRDFVFLIYHHPIVAIAGEAFEPNVYGAAHEAVFAKHFDILVRWISAASLQSSIPAPPTIITISFMTKRTPPVGRAIRQIAINVVGIGADAVGLRVVIVSH
jgi:hypothetical protein